MFYELDGTKIFVHGEMKEQEMETPSKVFY